MDDLRQGMRLGEGDFERDARVAERRLRAGYRHAANARAAAGRDRRDFRRRRGAARKSGRTLGVVGRAGTLGVEQADQALADRIAFVWAKIVSSFGEGFGSGGEVAHAQQRLGAADQGARALSVQAARGVGRGHALGQLGCLGRQVQLQVGIRQVVFDLRGVGLQAELDEAATRVFEVVERGVEAALIELQAAQVAGDLGFEDIQAALSRQAERILVQSTGFAKPVLPLRAAARQVSICTNCCGSPWAR